MPRPGLPLSRCLRINLLLLLASLCATPASARNPDLAKYPLRVHVLASDQTYRTPRMNPGIPVTCDSTEGILSSISLDSGNGPVSLNGFSGDPCAVGPDFMRGGMLDPQAGDPVYSGAGRGDLVSPPSATQGLAFHYSNCSRVRVLPGFQSLRARWKRPGKQLEVLIPSDAIPVGDRPLPLERCTFTVTLNDFVYLLLRNGALVQVAQQDYWRKPALRLFLSGNAQPMQDRSSGDLPNQDRSRQFTVPAHPTN